MCEPTTIMLITTAVAGGIAAKGQYEQGQMAKQVGRNNEIMAAIVNRISFLIAQ